MTTPVEVVSQSIVKPSSPTPNHLRRYQLSSLDQVMGCIFVPWIVFYPGQATNVTNKGRSERLKKSLSQTLSKFYPVAGRFRDNYSFVECNDEGVQFVEAKAKGSIFDVIKHRNLEDLNNLLPCESRQVNDLVAVAQVTHFDCGGTVIGLHFQHKIGDVVSSIDFLNSWGAITRGNNHRSPPWLDLAARFPPINIGDFDRSSELANENVSLKWFMCNAQSIAALRDRYGQNSDTAGKRIRPSRIEALTAFITSRIMAAIQLVNSSDSTYLVHHPINLRPRMHPPLSEQHFGNIIVEPVVATADTKANDGWCYGIIPQMRETISSVDAEYVKNLKVEEHMDMIQRAQKLKEENVTPIFFTSFCRFPLYDIDFGWGKPAWVGLGGWPAHNLVVLLDSKVEGDIEVYILLKDEVMANFENDKKLRAFLFPVEGA